MHRGQKKVLECSQLGGVTILGRMPRAIVAGWKDDLRSMRLSHMEFFAPLPKSCCRPVEVLTRRASTLAR